MKGRMVACAIAVAGLVALLFGACSSDSGNDVVIVQYTVSFDSQGASTAASPSSIVVTAPATVVGSLPSDPDLSGYSFGGWWTGKDGSGTEFLATTAVTADITVYAYWVAETPATSFTYTATSTAVTITAYTGSDATVVIPSKIEGLPVTTIAYAAFKNCTTVVGVTIPSSVTSLGSSVFYGCSGLTSIVIPSSITALPQSLFSNCTKLASVTIPESVTSIGTNTFSSCTGLLSLTLPSGLKYISMCAFFGATGLGSLTIPASVISIGQEAFLDCTSLTAISVESGNTVYSSADGVLFNSAKTTLVSYPAGKPDASYSIPSSVTTISAYAFMECPNITSVVIPATVSAIGNYAFQGCDNNLSVSIAASSITIGNQAFAYSDKLASVSFPATVVSMGDMVFYSCYSLASFSIDASPPPPLGSSAFSACSSSLKIKVPSASVDAYRSATNWVTYATSIVSQ